MDAHFTQLKEELRNIDRALAHARRLAELSATQNGREAIETAAELEALHEMHPDNPEIAYACCLGLYNMLHELVEPLASETLEKIEKINKFNDKDERIALLYARGIVLNMFDKEEAELVNYANQLRQIYLLFTADKDFIQEYAKGLGILAQRSSAYAASAYGILEKMYKLSPSNIDIANAYAKSLHSLMKAINDDKNSENTKCFSKIQPIVKKLNDVFDLHSDDPRIAHMYAEGLYCIESNKQHYMKRKDAESAMPPALKFLMLGRKFKNNDELFHLCAEALNYLCLDNGSMKIALQINTMLEELLYCNPNDERVAFNYADSFLCLFGSEWLDKVKFTVATPRRVHELCQRFIFNKKVALPCLQGILLFAYELHGEDMLSALDMAEQICEQNREDDDFSSEYMSKLAGMLQTHNYNDSLEIIQRYEESKYPVDWYVSSEYAGSIKEILKEQNRPDSSALLQLLRKQYILYPEIDRIMFSYLYGLQYYCEKSSHQSALEALRTMEKDFYPRRHKREFIDAHNKCLEIVTKRAKGPE